MIALGPHDAAEVAEARREVGVSGPEGLFQNRRGSTVERRRFDVVPLGFENLSQIVQAGRDLQMILTEDPLGDIQGASRQRFGGSVVLLRFKQLGQVVEASSHVGMVGPQSLLQNGQGSAVQGLRLPVVSQEALDFSQVVQAGRHVDVFGSKEPFPDFERSPVERRGFGPVFLQAVNGRKPVHALSEAVVFQPQGLRILDSFPEECGGFDESSLLQGSLGRGVEFDPVLLFLGNHLEQDKRAADSCDWTDLPGTDIRERVPELGLEIVGGDSPQVPAPWGRSVYGVLPRFQFKRCAGLDSGANL